MIFALGFLGRISLHDYHNFETIMVSAFLASMLLPSGIAYFVTISMIVLSDVYLGYFGSSKIILFTYSGFIIISIITSFFKKNIDDGFNTSTIYKFTATGILFALIYDTWTNFGVFWLSYNHSIENLIIVYILGIPFMIYHILSSIITFTLLGFPLYFLLSSDTKKKLIFETQSKVKA